MSLPYYFRKTKKIENLLNELEVKKRLLPLLPRSKTAEGNLLRKSLLKSALFSARIEGNPLKLEDIGGKIGAKTKEKIEIQNLLTALNFINSKKFPKKISAPLILKLHKIVLRNLSPNAGHFRQEPSAIFNQAKIAIYFAPPPARIPGLVTELIHYANRSKDETPAKSAVFHFAFEKIHPFLDGNGRVGRLLSTAVLKQRGFDIMRFSSLEEFFENNRDEYYRLLGEPKKDISEFVEFFVEGLNLQAQKALEELSTPKKEAPEDFLLPRRQEILQIIKDHQRVNFDFLHRRFLSVPKTTLHYDIQSLLKKNFIRKLGTTRGVLYTSLKPHSA